MKVRALVLHDGHVDHITGPRCLIQPKEGRHMGLYLIAHTNEVFKAGDDVVYDYHTRRAILASGAGK